MTPEFLQINRNLKEKISANEIKWNIFWPCLPRMFGSIRYVGV